MPSTTTQTDKSPLTPAELEYVAWRNLITRKEADGTATDKDYDTPVAWYDESHCRYNIREYCDAY